MVRYLSLEWIDALTGEVDASSELPCRCGSHVSVPLWSFGRMTLDPVPVHPFESHHTAGFYSA